LCKYVDLTYLSFVGKSLDVYLRSIPLTNNQMTVFIKAKQGCLGDGDGISRLIQCQVHAIDEMIGVLSVLPGVFF